MMQDKSAFRLSWTLAATIAAVLCGIAIGAIVLAPFSTPRDGRSEPVGDSPATVSPASLSQDVPSAAGGPEGDSDEKSPPGPLSENEEGPHDRSGLVVQDGQTVEGEDSEAFALARESAAELIRALKSRNQGSDTEQGAHFNRIAIAFSRGLGAPEPWRDPAYETFIVTPWVG